MKLGEKIRFLREEKGISQQAMADTLSLNRVTVTGYEIGRRTPDIFTLKKIAEYLNVTIDYLLDDKL